jgi:hypothetical protein
MDFADVVASHYNVDRGVPYTKLARLDRHTQLR